MNTNLKIDNSSFIAPGAFVLGDVTLEKNTSVFHNAVLRGDMAPIVVKSGTNIQDNCTLHCDKGVPLTVGENVTVGHNAVLHSCTIGDNSLIGMGSVILSGAKIGKNAIVGAGSLVTSKTEVPDGTLYMGSPAKFIRDLTETEIKKNAENALEYQKLAASYMNPETSNSIKIETSDGLDMKVFEKICELGNLVNDHDGIVLKLNKEMLSNRVNGEVNDILAFKGKELVGFLGIYEMMKGCGEAEITAMVHPNYRKQGIFTKMYEKALEELKRREIGNVLLITYDGAKAGENFAKKHNFTLDHAEYAMSCKKENWNMCDKINLTFRRAVASDLKEMVFLDMLGFDLTREEAESFYQGAMKMEDHIAEYDQKPVGHISIIRNGKECLVCGLVVSPMQRRKGFGREILDYCLDLLFSDGFDKVNLEVDRENKVAQKLYFSAGFKVTDRYDYYKIAF